MKPVEDQTLEEAKRPRLLSKKESANNSLIQQNVEKAHDKEIKIEQKVEAAARIILNIDEMLSPDEIQCDLDDDIDNEHYTGKNINDSFVNKLGNFS